MFTSASLPSGYTTDLTIDAILASFQDNKCDTVMVMRKDSTDVMVYDLHSAQELFNVQLLLTSGMDSIAGMKLVYRGQLDHDYALASEMQLNEPALKSNGDNGAMEKNKAVEEKKSPDMFAQVPGTYYLKDTPDSVFKASAEEMKKVVKESSGGPGPTYYVGFPIKSPTGTSVHNLVVIELPWHLWMLKAEYVNIVLAMKAKALKFDNPPWASSFREVPIRKEQHGDNEYKRKKEKAGAQGRTVNRIIWKFSMSAGQMPMFQQMFLSAVKAFERLFHPDADPGRSYLYFLKEQAPGLVTHFKKTHDTDEKIQDYLQCVLVEGFSRSRNISMSMCLDKFLTDYHIKELLETIGYTSWEQVIAAGHMQHVYKDYPKKAVPSWESIEQLPYT